MWDILRNIVDKLCNQQGELDTSVQGENLETRVVCPDCDWKGTIGQSLHKDHTNDTCPQCGNTALTYEL